MAGRRHRRVILSRDDLLAEIANFGFRAQDRRVRLFDELPPPRSE